MQARCSHSTSQRSRTGRVLRVTVTVQNGYNYGYSTILLMVQQFCKLM